MRPARKSLPGQTIPGINDAHTDRDELKTPTGLPCLSTQKINQKHTIVLETMHAISNFPVSGANYILGRI